MPPDPRRSFTDLEQRIGWLERRVDEKKSRPPSRRNQSAFITVAAHNTNEMLAAQATYRCDGTNDHVELQQAFDVASADFPGAMVILLGGTFNVGDPLNIACNVFAAGDAIISGPGSAGLVTLGGSHQLHGVIISAATAATAPALYAPDLGMISDCQIVGVSSAGVGLVRLGRRCLMTNCSIGITGGAGDSLHIDDHSNAVPNLHVFPSPGGTADAGTVAVNGDYNHLGATLHWVLSDNDADFLHVTGSGNLCTVTVAGGAATTPVVTVSGDNNLVFYTPAGVYATDVDTGTGNRINPDVGGAGGSGIPASIVDVKGDMIVATAADTVDRQPVGADGTFLKADSAQATGQTWAVLADGDIPAGIARDAEVSGAVGDHEAAADPHAAYQKESEKGAANGYAALDAGGEVPTAQLATGTADATTFLRGDQTWATPAGAGATFGEAPGESAFGDVAAEGASDNSARADHTHSRADDGALFWMGVAG